MDSGLEELALGFPVALPAAATALARRAAGQRAMRAADALAGLAMLGFAGRSPLGCARAGRLMR